MDRAIRTQPKPTQNSDLQNKKNEIVGRPASGAGRFAEEDGGCEGRGGGAGEEEGPFLFVFFFDFSVWRRTSR